MSENLALLLPRKRAPFIVGPRAFVPPGPGEIAVRVRAVAVNPFDRYVQAIGDVMTRYLVYPVVAGTDVAGEVVAVGDGVSRFCIGDRVLGHAAGLEASRNSAAEGGFQHQTLLLGHMASPIPDALSFEKAAVLPLGLSTAACALFQPDMLALRPPQQQPRPTGEAVLVWGASSSVGCNAVQLARAAGYEAIATCSPHNAALMRALGACHVFDYRDPATPSKISAVLNGMRCAGAVAIGTGSTEACLEILGRANGNRFLARITPPASFDAVPAGRGRLRRLAPALVRMAVGNVAAAARARRHSVRTRMVWGGSLVNNAVGPMIYEGFLPEALAANRFRAAPEPIVVGHGLQHIPAALEQQRAGVSARKLVVTL